jgi:hypothetical protein
MQTVSCDTASAPCGGTSLLPLDALGATIRARIDAGDKATTKAEEHYKSAGLLLLEAKQHLPVEQPGIRFTAYIVGECKMQTSRAYELIAIAEGRTTVAEVQADGRERAARHAAKNKAARDSVSNVKSPCSPLSEQRDIVKQAMADANLADWKKLAKCATDMKSARDIVEADRGEVTKLFQRVQEAERAACRQGDTAEIPSDKMEAIGERPSIKWRLKHAPAKTVYTIQCHDVITLTYSVGVPIHPDDADLVAKAERTDLPERWELWAHIENMGWMQSAHDTKEAARAALRANRLAPPKRRGPFTIIDSSIAAGVTHH